jgi:tetratricopeptide (TPR) repeat protein
MNFRILLVIIYVFSTSLFAQQQKKIDSLESVLNQQTDVLKIHTYGELLKLIVYSDMEKAKTILEAEIELAKKLDQKPLIAKTKMDAGNYYSVKAEYEKSEIAYLEAKALFLEVQDTLNAAKASNNMVRSLMYQGNYEAGLKAALYALRINEKFKAPKELLIGNYMAIGNIQSTLERYDLSLEYYKKAEAVALKIDNPLRLAQVRHNLGENMKWLKQYEKAIPYFIENIEFYKSVKNEFKLANTYNSLGTVYFEIDSINVSKPYFEMSYEISERLGSKEGMAYNARNLGRISMSENNPKKALAYYKIGLNNSISSNSKGIMVADYNNVSSAYLAMGDYKNAYKNKVEHHRLQDSIYKKENIDKLNELEIQYQTEKKEAAIALQEEEIKTLNAQAKNDKLTKTLFGIGMLSFLAIAGLLYFGFKQHIKKNAIAREKQEEIYKQEIAFKKKELTSQTLHLVQKNTFIQELKENLEKIKQSPELFKVEFRRLVMLLKKESAEDKDWEVFKSYFSEVHNDFDNKIKSIANDITEKEIRLASFLRMNLSTKEIASMTNVLPDSVLKSKYRLKKKLQLEKEEDLTQFLNTI